MKTFYLALDLKNDPDLIEKYEVYHKEVWPEVKDDIRNQGIIDMEIYRVENRLFMVMRTDEEFDIESSATREIDPRIKEWEELMWQFQQALPNSKPGEKWRLMDKIFDLKG